MYWYLLRINKVELRIIKKFAIAINTNGKRIISGCLLCFVQ